MNHTAACISVEFFRASGAVEKIRKVQRCDHFDGTKGTAVDKPPRMPDGCVEAVAVTHHQMNPGASACIQHVGALIQRQCHGFFNQHVLAV